MTRRSLAFIFVPLVIAATLATTSVARAGFCCSFDYSITNHTTKGAEVTLWRNSILKSGHRITFKVWVPAHTRVKVNLPEDKVYWKLSAAFKSAGEGSRTVATADQDWWLQKGSADKLVEDNGRFDWEPGS